MGLRFGVNDGVLRTAWRYLSINGRKLCAQKRMIKAAEISEGQIIGYVGYA